MVSDSPSGSVAAALQARVVLVSIALDGVMEIPLKDGAELPTMTLALEVLCSLAVSVAVMVHSIISVGCDAVLVSVREGDEPSAVDVVVFIQE